MGWGNNRYTLYTPNTSRKIQLFLEGRAIWDPSSSTGFSKYNPISRQMEEYTNHANGQKVPQLFRVPVTTILGYYDPSPTRGLGDYIYPALHGAYGFVYNDDGGSSTGTADGCELVVKTNSGSSPLVFTLTTSIYSNEYMNKFHVNVATEDEPNEALIYCYNELRTSLALNGPNENQPPLIYTVNGVQFDDHPGTPTTTPTSSPTTSPTIAPITASPTASPTESPTMVTIASDDFESSGNTIFLKYNKLKHINSYEGSYSIKLQKKAKATSNTPFIISDYTKVRFDFWYQPKFYSVNEGFALFVKFNGAPFQKVAEWKMGQEFNSNDIGNWIKTEVDIPTSGKWKISKFYFKGKGNSWQDAVFIDELYILGGFD